MGDLNGRTKTGEDFVRDNLDKYSPINNSSYMKDTELTRNNKDQHPIDQQGKIIIELCKSSSLRILNGRTLGDKNGQFTRYPLNKPNENPSTIDYALSGISVINEIFSFSVLPFTELSDHCCISATIKVNRECINNGSTVKTKTKEKIYTFDQKQIGIFKENIRTDKNLIKLNTILDKIEPSQDDVLCSISRLNDVLLSAGKRSFLPRNNDKKTKANKPTKHKSKKWFNKECAKYRQILRKYSRNLSTRPFDRNTLNLFQKCRNEYKSVCRKAEKQYRHYLTEKLCNIEQNDPKVFWNIIKQMNNWGKDKTDETDNITPSNWHKYFKTLLNRTNPTKEATSTQTAERMNDVDTPSLIYESFNPILDSRISTVEMREAISKLKNKKSPGPDGIPVEYLKVFGGMYEDILLKIVRILFSRHIYPPQWDTNYLIPIYKKDDVEDPDNYRGLAVGSSFAKLLSLILLGRLVNFITTYKLISPNQIGFMKGSRTSDHIFLLQTIIEKIVKKGKGKLYTAFIDFKKAYDTVDREILFKTLKQMGISGLFLNNIKAMYNKTKYSIKVKDGYLDPISSNLGLRQGCPLSPILFNLYIENLKYSFDDTCDPVTIDDVKLNHFLYADDLVLISRNSSGLQRSLDKLTIYAEQKQLTINTKKSKTMIFTPTGKYINEKFSVNSMTLEAVKSFCYLGFEVKPSGTVKHAMNTLHDKANKALRPLLCAIARFNIPVKTSVRLFHTYISPIILYNVENWAIMTDKELRTFTEADLFVHTNNSKSDIIHRKLIKYTLGLPKSCPNIAIHGDAGEVPISIKGYRLMLDYWNRLNTLPESNLAKKALKENISLRTNWIITIEKLVKSYNLTETVDEPQKFKLALKPNSNSYYISLWEAKIKEVNLKRLEFYQTINNNFSPAKYIDLPNFKMRKTIAKLRCSSHCLEIEKGRHRNIPRDERLCKICKNNVIEDEEHFLVGCKTYDNLKTKHNIITSNAAELMNCTDQQNLAQYIEGAFNLRENTLNANI